MDCGRPCCHRRLRLARGRPDQRRTSGRIIKAHLHYTISGHGIEHAKAMRAIELGVTKYCTVRDSLCPDMPVTWSLDLSDATRESRAAAPEGESA